MNEFKKFLFIFPPAWMPIEPHLALPSLAAQLKANNYDAKVMDLNIDFMNYIFTSEYLRKSLNLAKEQYQNLSARLGVSEASENGSTYEDKVLNYKYRKLDSFFKIYKEKPWDYIIESIDAAIETYKNPDLFYNYKHLTRADKIRRKAEELISLPYYPLSVNMYTSDVAIEIMPLNYNDIKNVVFDSSVNIFKEFLQKYADDIKKENYDYIGISISSKSQLIAGLTIANMLKQTTDAHISIGGTFFSRVIESIKKYPEFFDLFAHSLSVEEGEISIVETAKFINGEIPISAVHNILYKDGDEIIFNGIGEHCILSKMALPDFSDYDFSKYFSPEGIIPVQTQRGCYWRKCTFCDMTHGKTYTVKKISSLIDELKEYKLKYNISCFDIIDEAIVPEYLEKLCDALIENKMDIKFGICLRMEKKIDYKLLKKAYKAGLRCIQWGLETGNERIHTLINKGVDFKNRLNILKASNKAGIVNMTFTFYAFPSEEYKEAMDTHDFIFKNRKYIQNAGTVQFNLARFSAVNKNPEKYGVTVNAQQPDFWYGLYYSVLNGMSEEEKRKYETVFWNDYHKYYGRTIFGLLQDATLILLYNSKYKLDYLRKIDTGVL